MRIESSSIQDLLRLFYRGLSPEIVQFKTTADGSPQSDRDWYIKGSRCVVVFAVTKTIDA